MKRSIFILGLAAMGCVKTNPEPSAAGYFPGSTWESQSIESLGWKPAAVAPLKDFLASKKTKAFLILVNGKIVMETYFDGHTATSDWEWNSAGKTLVATTIGKANEEKLLTLDQSAADLLGSGWTAMPTNKEHLIKIRHLLSMTSGIDDTKQLTIRANLNYVADAGTRWAYGNVFQKLMDVVAKASGKSFDGYFNEKLKNKIGMDGYWNIGPIFSIYHSTARSMARFGLLALHNGKWKDEQIVPETYFKESISSSQTINPAYGYLWWLNGKARYMVPAKQTVFNGSLVPAAPVDMYAAMGAADQRLYIIPSKNMVVVRMGEASDPANASFAVSGFDNTLWEKINGLIQ